MKLLPEDKERLIKYVVFLETELSDHSRFLKTDWKTYSENRDERRNLERWIENIVNCSIDMAKVILVVENRRIPSTYKEILKDLGATPHFDENFGEALSQWAALRNILAHEYIDLRWHSVHKFIQSAIPIYRQFIETIKPHLS